MIQKRGLMMAAFLLAGALGLSACGKKEEAKDASLTEAEAKEPGSAGEVYVYNWGEYIDETVIEDFENETGIKVVYDLFETNEEMYPVVEAGGVVYDVVCPSDYMIKKMIDNDLLAEINLDNVSNVKNIGEKYLDFAKAYDPENKYSVPYNWGTVGILYNTSMVEGDPDSWDVLWDEKYKGEILMQDSVRDAFMVGQKKLGFSINTTDKAELEKVRDLLIEQKPLVQAYVIDQVRDKMIGGEAALAVIYSGEMLYIQNEVAESGEDFELKYVIPKEGSNVWLDGWVIPKNAKNKENAEKWIDFMCRGDIAKKNFEYITYPTPNTAAFELLDKEMQENKAVFPDDEMLKNCEVFEYLGPEAEDQYNAFWKEIKSN
ncbi:MAG: ABC transporter substrate-binding protein [Johnsonella sp.]|nr:ABC transporter substrate-binding protein [Johnsonella sp.]